MRHLRHLVIFLLFLGLPATLLADISNLPAASTWYFHADFEEMRTSEALPTARDDIVDALGSAHRRDVVAGLAEPFGGIGADRSRIAGRVV